MEKCKVEGCQIIYTEYQCKNCPNQVLGSNNKDRRSIISRSSHKCNMGVGYTNPHFRPNHPFRTNNDPRIRLLLVN
ncbi:hypothetical protein ES708_07782 [subsurface metagenome]